MTTVDELVKENYLLLFRAHQLKIGTPEWLRAWTQVRVGRWNLAEALEIKGNMGQISLDEEKRQRREYALLQALPASEAQSFKRAAIYSALNQYAPPRFYCTVGIQELSLSNWGNRTGASLGIDAAEIVRWIWPIGHNVG